MNFASSTTWYNLAQVAKCKSEYKSSRMGLTSQSCTDCRNNNDILSMCNKFADRSAAGSPHPRTGNVGKFHQGGGRGWWGEAESLREWVNCKVLKGCTGLSTRRPSTRPSSTRHCTRHRTVAGRRAAPQWAPCADPHKFI